MGVKAILILINSYILLVIFIACKNKIAKTKNLNNEILD
jgi:hypothetical protein